VGWLTVGKQHVGKLIRDFHERLFVIARFTQNGNFQRGTFGGIHKHIFWRGAVMVPGVGPLKNSTTNSRKDSDFNEGIDPLISAKRQLGNLLKVLLHFLVSHGSTLSIIPRSELERLEKRGLEVKG